MFIEQLRKLTVFAKNKFYRGRIRNLSRYMGVERCLSKVFWRFQRRLVEDYFKTEFKDNTIYFRIESFSEYVLSTTLMNESEVIEQIIEDINVGDVFYDVGASIGLYSLNLAPFVGEDNVYAFEPNPINNQRLEENAELNNLDISIIETALSNTNGKVGFSVPVEESGYGGSKIDEGSNTLTVESKKGDCLIDDRGLSPPDVLKIDVEGAEFQVLQGLEKTIEEHHPLIICEVHTDYLEKFDSTEKEIHDFLENKGYQVGKLIEMDYGYCIRAQVGEKD